MTHVRVVATATRIGATRIGRQLDGRWLCNRPAGWYSAATWHDLLDVLVIRPGGNERIEVFVDVENSLLIGIFHLHSDLGADAIILVDLE